VHIRKEERISRILEVLQSEAGRLMGYEGFAFWEGELKLRKIEKKENR